MVQDAKGQNPEAPPISAIRTNHSASQGHIRNADPEFKIMSLNLWFCLCAYEFLKPNYRLVNRWRRFPWIFRNGWFNK